MALDPVTATLALVPLFGGGGGDSPRLGEVVSAINTSLQTITDSIIDNLYRSTFGPIGAIGNAENNIIAQIIGSEGSVRNTVINSESNLRSFIELAARAVDRSSYNRDAAIQNVILGTSDSILRSIGKSVLDIVNPITLNTDGISKQIVAMDTKVSTQYSVVEQVMREVLGHINRKIEYVIENTIVLESDIFRVILDNVKDVIDVQGNITRDVVKVFDSVINGTFAEAQAKMLIPEEDQAKEQKRIADAVEKMAKRKDPFAGEGITGPAGDYAIGVTIDTIRDWWTGADDTIKDAWGELLTAINGTGFAGALDDDCMLPLLRRGHAKGLIGFITTALTTAMSWGILPFQMATVQANRQLQGFRTCYPDQLLSPAQMREMFHILGYSRGELVELFQRQGYSKDDANTLMKTWETPADLTLLTAMLFRDVIGKQEWAGELRKHGYTPETVKNIEKIIRYIPPVQDLITMSVRDVFDEATVRLNRQSEDYPPEFTHWMQQQGVDKQWAEKYWQAHWRLPSETMGFEMFHRGIIDETRLKSLMKSLDIMPGWRDQLVKLSYNPLTRVDVRRMHSVGVLSEKEVERAYLDIGYSPENAKRLTEFTVVLNDGEGAANLNVADDLTRGNIIAFYKDGVIDRVTAQALLLAEGMGALAAELLLQSADFDIERDERKQLKALILARFKSGRWSYQEAVNEAQRLNFSDREREQIILELELIQAKDYKLPSRVDLDKMLGAGVIDSSTYVEALMANGYSELWANRYLELLEMNNE